MTKISEPGPTVRLARFATTTEVTDLPTDVVTRLTQCLLDFIGVTVCAGVQAESSQAIRDGVLILSGAEGPATVIGEKRGYPLEYAVLLNGAFAHSMDFDDTNITSALHPGAPVIPVVIAIGEREDSSGAEVLAALAVGYEVCCRVGAALGQSAYDRGFHPTAIAGIFGAVAAGARLLHFTEDQLVSAFGLAGSMAAGSMQYMENGSWNKRLHPGLAAHNALLAIAFTSAGVRGADEALEGRRGVLAAYGDNPQPQWLIDHLGEQWVLLDTGIKPYPACRLGHGAIDAALNLRDQLGGTIPPDATFTLHISPTAYKLVGTDEPSKTKPGNTVDGQFSAYFHTAIALLDGVFTWSSYQRLGDTDVQALIRRIQIRPDEKISTAGAFLTGQLVNGRTYDVQVDEPTGEPGSGLPWKVLEDKYVGLARPVFGDEGCREIAQQVRALPDLKSIRALMGLLRV